MLLFSLKSGPWTGNELATDDVEICENSQLTLANLSHLLKFCISQRWNTLEIISDSDVYLFLASSIESCDTSYSNRREEMEVASTVQPYEGEPRCIKRRFRRRLTKTVSRLQCLGQDRTKNSRYWVFREVIGQFHCKLLLSSEIAKAELSSRSSSRSNRTTTSRDTVFFFGPIFLCLEKYRCDKSVEVDKRCRCQ